MLVERTWFFLAVVGMAFLALPLVVFRLAARMR